MNKIPGIVSTIGNQNNEFLSSIDLKISHGGRLKFEEFSSDLVKGYIGHHKTFFSSAVAENSDLNIGIVIDGYITNGNFGKPNPTPDDLITEYLELGENFIKGLNGAFNLLLWDQRSTLVLVGNDRYGLRPTYYYIKDGYCVIAPQSEPFFNSIGIEKQLNRDSIYNLISYSRFCAGNNSFYSKLDLLPPASILTWRKNQSEIHKYWDYKFNPFSSVTSEHVSDFVDIFRSAISDSIMPFKRLGVNLSGGLDSRSVLAAIPASDLPKVDCFTWGYDSNCEEVRLAKQTSEIYGAKWNFVKLTPEDFIERASEGIKILDGRDISVQSYGLKAFPQVAKKVDVSVTGLFFDVICGGSYSTQVMRDNSPMDEVRSKKFLRQYNNFSQYQKVMFLDSDDAFGAVERISNQLIDDMGDNYNQHPVDVVDRFAMRQRGWRYIFTRQLWQRLFVEDVIPTFDNRVVDFLMQIPPSWRTNHKFYRMFLSELSKEAMDIPYQRTLLPPSVPVKYWNMANGIERSREELLRKIYYESNGSHYIKYNRYYSNFDEWFRENKNWQKYFKKMLLSDDSRLCSEYINRNWVKSCFEEQVTGKSSFYSILISLVTAELILRECS